MNAPLENGEDSPSEGSSNGWRVAFAIGVVVNLGFIAWVFGAAWHAAQMKASSAGDVAQEGQLVVAASGLILSSVLAWVTGLYAYLTRGILRSQIRMTQATTDQLEIARRQIAIDDAALAATIRPWFAENRDAVSRRVGNQHRTGEKGALLQTDQTVGNILCAVRIENVGNGLALIVPGTARLKSSPACTKPDVSCTGKATRAAVPRGTTTELDFHLACTSASWIDLTLADFANQAQTTGEFSVEFEYTDATGGQRTRVELSVAGVLTPAGKDAPPNWVVLETKHFRQGESEPFAIC